MIELKEVTKEYSKGVAALNGVNLKIEQGEFVFIVGDSGSGKSTLIRLIMKELDPTSGTITVNGNNLNRMRHRKVPMFFTPCFIVYPNVLILITIPTFFLVADNHTLFHCHDSLLHLVYNLLVVRNDYYSRPPVICFLQKFHNLP